MANLSRRRGSSLWRGSEESPRTLQREIDRLFEDFFRMGGERSLAETEFFTPSVELKETENDYRLSVELPGIRDEDIHVEVDENGVLTISGEKRHVEEKKEQGYEYSERVYGRFMRAIQLPTGVDAGQIGADYDNGVLEVRVPKTAMKGATPVPIRKGGREVQQGQQGTNVPVESRSHEEQEEKGDGSKEDVIRH